MEPYLGALQAWLVRGAVDEQWDEFFVVKSGRSVPVHSPEYWASCFVLRGAESGGVPARQPPVPSFLSEVADGILSAGKAVHLMSRLDSSGDEDALPAEEIRRSAPTGPAAQRLKAPLIGGEDGALFRAFCDSVRALAGEHGGGPGEGPKPAPPPAVQRLSPLLSSPVLCFSLRPPVQALSDRSPPARALCPRRSRRAPRLPDAGSEWAESPPQKTPSIGPSPAVEGPEPLPPVSDDSLWWSWPPRKAHPAGLPHRRGDGSSDRESRSGDVTEPFEGDAGVSLPGAASLVSVAAYTGGAGHHGRRPFARRDQPPRSAPLSLPPRAVACLPPPSVLVDRCLLRPISRQVEAADRDLLERLLGPWGLMSELRLLRGVFLMGSSALEPFSVELFETVGESPGMLSRVPAFQVEAMLKTMVPRVIGEGASNLDQSRITVDLDSSACGTDAAEAARRGVPHINELLALQVKYRARAPLRMVLDDTVLDAYSAALVFLLQVRWARHAVDRCRMALFRRLRRDKLRATSGARQRLRLLDSRHVFASLQEMMHFATNLQQYVTDRNLFSSWSELEQAIDAASSIDDVIQEHKLYMKKVQTHCLLLKEKYVRFMQDGVLHTLNHLLQWCKVVQRQAESDAVSEETTHSLEDPQTEMYRLKSEYDRSHRYLLKILHAIKDSQTGAYYGLEHLLMRLEYNRPS
uniref:Gamma-tubulin complex component n=1 Tax=Tetraselmis sp. GSL018 TaxID=582737 RepID=A0A061S7Q9_9CHLO